MSSDVQMLMKNPNTSLSRLDASTSDFPNNHQGELVMRTTTLMAMMGAVWGGDGGVDDNDGPLVTTVIVMIITNMIMMMTMTMSIRT